MSKTFFTLVLVAFLCAPVWAQEKFQAYDNVKIGDVSYALSETNPEPELEVAIVKAVKARAGDEIRYLYGYPALGAPGTRHALVLLVGPEWSGTGGATALLFEGKENPKGERQTFTYRLLAKMSPINAPFLLGPGTSHGLKNITTLVSGGGARAHYVTLKFDGKTYPTNPTVAESTPAGTTLSGTALLADVLSPESGLRLKVKTGAVAPYTSTADRFQATFFNTVSLERSNEKGWGEVRVYRDRNDEGGGNMVLVQRAMKPEALLKLFLAETPGMSQGDQSKTEIQGRPALRWTGISPDGVPTQMLLIQDKDRSYLVVSMNFDTVEQNRFLESFRLLGR